MSEYETTDLGGDPVEFEFVEGGTYERGVIRSTADRQQIRRDAERTIEVANHHSYYQISDRIATTREVDLARHCLALLTELAQAEGEKNDLRVARDTYLATAQWHANKAREAEGRLANVPALVELLLGLRQYFVGFDIERTDGKTSPAIAQIDAALAAYQESIDGLD